MKKSYLVIALLVLAMLACSLATPTPTPEPTATPTPVIVTATPAPIDLGKDVIMAPPSYWMDSEILKQFPDAAVWPPVGVEKGARLYRLFRRNGEHYMAIFEQGEEKWRLVDTIKISATPAPEPLEYMKDT